MAKTSYTVDELAVESGMSPDRVRGHCRSGDFGFQDGKQWIITHASYMAWAEREEARHRQEVGR